MTEKKTMHKKLLLAAAGLGLQAAGSVCILVSSFAMMKEANRKLRQALIQHLEND